MLLTRVLDAIAQVSDGLSRCIVVSADRDALVLANRLGAIPLPDGPEPGLNAALATACHAARARRATSILIPAADLPDASRGALARLRDATPRGSAAIIADKLGCGTNGLLLPANCDAKFAFGQNSSGGIALRSNRPVAPWPSGMTRPSRSTSIRLPTFFGGHWPRFLRSEGCRTGRYMPSPATIR